MKSKFKGVLGRKIKQHLELRRALGRDYKANETTLFKLNELALKRWPRKSTLTRLMVQEYFKTNTHLRAISRRNEMTYLRMFAQDLAAEGIETYMPERRTLPKAKSNPRVHIFTEKEIKSVMEEARKLNGEIPPVMYPTLIGLYWVTGLRLCEAQMLNVGDVDIKERTIFVQNGKFRKSRLIPISKTTADALERHIRSLKRLKFSTSSDAPLFLSARRTRISKRVVSYTLGRLYKKAEIKTANGKSPRNHDIRHSFATHALKGVKRKGEDPSNMIPALALVMGHTSLVHTQIYLHPSMETLQVASKAFEKKLSRFGRAS